MTIWAGWDPAVLAHELGHALRLLHGEDTPETDDDGPENLMNGLGGTELTEWQTDTMRRAAWGSVSVRHTLARAVYLAGLHMRDAC